jgi:hypothetical protein
MPRLRGGLGEIACAFVLATGVLVSGCGGGDDVPSGGLASLAPPDAPLFAEAAIRPDAGQAAAINSFAERIGGIPDPGGEVAAQIDAFLSANQSDANYADDIEPWLGGHGAVFVSSFKGSDSSTSAPDFAATVEVTDADAARAFLQRVVEQDPATEEKRTYEGTEYYASAAGQAAGVIDDYALAIGTETGLKVAVDASQGESLAESPEYTDRVDALPDGALASVFFEPASLIEAGITSNGLDPAQAQMIGPILDGPLSQPIAATLTATPDAASVDVAAMIDANASLSTESSLLTDLPGGSWFAIALPELGTTLSHSLDQLSSSGLPGAGEIERQVRAATGLELSADVFSWLGDAAAFVKGTGAPGFTAGLIAQTSGPQAPRALLDALEKLAEKNSDLGASSAPEGTDYGFSIGLPGISGGAEAGVVGDMFVAVAGATVKLALEPSERLGDDPAFQAAISSLGDDVSPALYVDLPSFFQVAEQGSAGSVDYAAVRPYLDAFASLVAGSRVDGDLALTRFTVLLGDG